MNSREPKPVVTQADRDCLDGMWITGFRASARGETADEAFLDILARHRLIHSPSEPSVVTQDLVPVGLDDCETAEDVAYYWWRQALEARGAIEAAQIAARNDALGEVIEALCDEDKIPSLFDRGTQADEYCAFNDGLDVAAEIVRALLTPLQQEREG